MSKTNFLGRGEERVVKILRNLYPEARIYTQMPISNIVSADSARELGTEYIKHRFDIFLVCENHDLAIEINYEHGTKAYKKWHNVYESHLKQVFCKPVAIEDSECESLFQLNKDKTHTDTWQDYIDVIRALEKAGVVPE
jgi:hypothetical protein